MKRILMAIVCLVTAFACERRAPTEDERAEADVRALVKSLSRDASVRAIRASGAVRENLRGISEKSVRRALILDWEGALKSIRLEGLRPGERYWRVREACHMLFWDLVCAMRDAECSHDEIWHEIFGALTWLDRQVVAMKPERTAGGSLKEWRTEDEKWRSYQALAEYRETVIENLERAGFDEQIYPNDVAKPDEIRKRLEAHIGRHVRSRDEITRLGLYVKQVRSRIQKERAEAMKEMSAKDAGEK